jgi:phytoene synthase
MRRRLMFVRQFSPCLNEWHALSEYDGLLDTLPALNRLALAYCPGSATVPTLAFFALDARLASLLRNASEPMLARLRLAWWRESLATDPSQWPEGEPLLNALRSWTGERDSLVSLVDGWEAMSGEPSLTQLAIEELAAARAGAFAALARLVGVPQESEMAARRGQAWSLADIASRLTDPEEKRIAKALFGRQDWKQAGLSRHMRPLVVLHGLAARSVRRGEDLDRAGPLALAAAIRLGLLGR